MTCPSLRALTLTLALVATGCGRGSEPFSPRPVASIVVSPTAIMLDVGQSLILTAITRDAYGNVLEGRAISWSVDEPNVTISATGVLVGRKTGYAHVVASSEGKTFGVMVTVVSDEPSAYELLYRRRGENDKSDIMTLQPGTGFALVVVTAGLPVSHPTASPDGSRIAFAVAEYDALSEGNELVSSIYVADRDGQNLRRLTRGYGSEDQPAWSPNGDRIASRQVDSSGRADIWVMNADGSNSSNLTADLPLGADQRAPAWSPGGEAIAFVQPGVGVFEVYTVRSNGTDVRLRTTEPAWGGGVEPTWIRAR